ncbi:MAG TPA: PASTA domain-containing protein [candidate division Zixibacteria bacterium]|nr:PASTA domain-containing protein [candidate division Zixibacteria bacterium]
MNRKLAKILYRLIYLVALAGGIIGGVMIFDRVLMTSFTRARGVREIPDVVGMSESEAATISRDSGFDFIVSRREYSDSIPETFVISQRPSPGTMAKKGRRVSVVISLSSEIFEIPEVTNIHYRQARLELDAMSLIVGETTREHCDTIQRDFVIATNPPMGAQAEAGDTVDLIVSLGSERAILVVPNFMGQSIEQAEKIAKEEGLELIINYRIIPTMQAKTIYRQAPEPGARVERGSSITVIAVQEGR